MTEEDKQRITILWGEAFLKPEEEKDHFGLYRYLMHRRYDEKTGQEKTEKTEPPVGPLMIFRVAKKDDRVDMRTVHPETMQELKLLKVWDGRKGFV